MLQYDMFEFYMNDEQQVQIDEQLEVGGLDEEYALSELASYEVLKNLKQTREELRSQFPNYGICEDERCKNSMIK